MYDKYKKKNRRKKNENLYSVYIARRQKSLCHATGRRRAAANSISTSFCKLKMKPRGLLCVRRKRSGGAVFLLFFFAFYIYVRVKKNGRKTKKWRGNVTVVILWRYDSLFEAVPLAYPPYTMMAGGEGVDLPLEGWRGRTCFLINWPRSQTQKALNARRLSLSLSAIFPPSLTSYIIYIYSSYLESEFLIFPFLSHIHFLSSFLVRGNRIIVVFFFLKMNKNRVARPVWKL